MLQAILQNFSHYNLQELIGLLVTPSFYSSILLLIALEISLSADNAVVLALVVKHLPEQQRNKALRIGIVCAYLLRFLAIGIGTYLVKLTWVKVIGGGYLLYMAVKYFYEMYFGKDEDKDGIPDALEKGFLMTVLTVEGLDICFSVDSILAAFGVSSSVWVLLIGGCLGILAMRFAAQKFVTLLEKVPEIETAAYVLIGFIGTKMITSLSGYEIYDWVSTVMMVCSFGGAFLVNYLKKVEQVII